MSSNNPNRVYLDTETTGLHPEEGDEILSLTIVDSNGRLLFDERFKPKHKKEWPEAQAVNHISPDDVEHLTTIDAYMEQICHILDRIADEIVGYNIAFDIGFLKAAGATILRGGTYKPRTSPYAFAGLGEEGLRLLAEAGREFQLPTVSEITDAALLPQFEEIDILQVGARNMQNYTLLQALGRQPKPVLLKRGLAATYEEWLASAEYILREGNPHVILCERGIRSYQSGTRATLDLAAIPVMQGLTHLPVLVDPSHASGVAGWIPALGRAAIAAGAGGLMVEVHTNPAQALSDGEQALLPQDFARLAADAHKIWGLLHP